MSGLYLAVDLGVLAAPLLLSFDKRVNFFSQWKDFWPVNLVVLTFFIAWDVLFTKWGIWGFNPDYLLGPEWLGLPLEEWLFFICIPYASVFTYAVIKSYVRQNPLRHSAITVTMTAIAITGGLAFGFPMPCIHFLLAPYSVLFSFGLPLNTPHGRTTCGLHFSSS